MSISSVSITNYSDNSQSLLSTILLSILVFAVFLTSQGVLFFYFLYWEFKKQEIDIFKSKQNGELIQLILENENNGTILTPTALYSSLICIAFIFLVLKLKKKSFVNYLDLNQPKLKQSLIWIGIACLYIIIFEVLGTHFDSFKTEFTGQVLHSANSKILLFLSVGFIAPVFEEIFFRGFLFKGIETSQLGPNGAVIITSLLFAMMHIQYNFFILSALIPLGFILGFAKLKTKSLFVPIIIHVLNNTLSFYLID